MNSGADNISPQRVEGMLTIEPEIAQAMVYGDKQPHLVALIVPDEDFTIDWIKANGSEKSELVDLIEDEYFVASIRKALDRVNLHLNTIERVRRFKLISEPFSIDNEMLTPSMKIRRHVIKECYGEDLEALYGT